MRVCFPNKPQEMFKAQLSELDKEPGKYYATQKVDGWRCMIIKDHDHQIIKSYKNGSAQWAQLNDYFFLSRRGFNKGGPTNLPVCDKISNIIASLNLPDKTILDSEWMARRTIGEIPETLFVFDVLWYKDEWMGTTPHLERMKLLRTLLKDEPYDKVRIPNGTDMDYSEFFEKQTHIPYTEGIVLKEVNSTLIADRVESPKNPSWIKIKWRSGSDGRETFNL